MLVLAFISFTFCPKSIVFGSSLYYKLNEGFGGCPNGEEIENLDECKNAVLESDLGKFKSVVDVDIVKKTATVPNYCSLNSKLETLYFSNNKINSESESYKQYTKICKIGMCPGSDLLDFKF